jgi:4-amino-4-deoxy-L-arabinose transferase-like glycosyltransferase
MTPRYAARHLLLGTLAILITGLLGVLFFYRLADRDLWSSHEGRAAQDAQSMLLDRDWSLPHLFDKKIEMQKPPLYYWLVAAIGWVRGGAVDAWAVRLPATGSALGIVLLLVCFCWKRGRVVAGLLAGTIVATALHFTWLARTGRIDMVLAFSTGIAMCSFYLGHCCRQTDRQWRACGWLLVAYVALAMGMLLKGPIGLILPLAVGGVFVITEVESGRWRLNFWLKNTHRYGLWWGLPLALVLSVPWYVWANGHTQGRFYEVFFWKHNIERGLGGGSLAMHPWWFYGPRFTFDFLPWSPLLPVAGILLWRRRWWPEDAEARFGLIWMLSMIGLLSSARFKRADYLLPAYPGAALWLGCVVERCLERFTARRVAFACAGLLGVFAAGWGFYLTVVLPQSEPTLEFRRFAEEIRKRAPAPEPIFFFRAEAHALAFHLGRDIESLLEWENLDIWVSRARKYYIVMPPETAREWPQYIKSGWLEEVLHSADLAGGEHAHPLVLLRMHPQADPRPSSPSH